MKRDLGALTDDELDVLVVGGGVYGAATAWDASLRGLRVGLIERADFGSGTSFNNLKTIHGGIRYLQHADLKRMRESIRERRNLMRIAPHLVHPLPFLVPSYQGSLLRSRTAMRVALTMNDAIGWDRNQELPPDKHLPPGRSLGPDECLALAPGLERTGLTGGALWYDAQMHNSDRMTLSFVLSAAAEGAHVANFVEGTDLLRDANRIIGVQARDRLDDTELRLRAKLVINAAGPWVDALLGGDGRRLFHFSKAMNLVTRPIVEDVAVGVTSRRPHHDADAILSTGGRFLCLVPWRGACLVGTAHMPYTGSPDALQSTEDDVESLIADVNDAYPRAELTRDDVRLVHRGLLPMKPGTNGGGVTLEKSYRLEDHRSDGVEGLLSIVGVKYTTARDVAEKAVDRALARLGRTPTPSRSSRHPVVGGDFASLSELVTEAGKKTDADVGRHLAYTYGTDYQKILGYDDRARVSPETPVLAAEVRHAVREEMAFDLMSVVLRRTELGSAGHPGRACLENCASILQSELGWTDARRADEIESVESFYRLRS